MPSVEQTKLIELLHSFDQAKTIKSRSELLGKAKQHILNDMTNEEVRGYFVESGSNFEQLFEIDVWTPSLDQTNGIVNFIEPYEIVDRVFNVFNSLDECLRQFNDQILFVLNQSKDEKVKHICVKQLYRLTERFDYDKLENPVASRDFAVPVLKRILPVFVKQIPKTSVSYSQLLDDLVCLLTIKLNKVEATIQANELRVDVFSCSVFDDNASLLAEYEAVARLDSINSFRVFELIIKLACLSGSHLSVICEAKFNLSQRIAGYLSVQQPDVLAQLNCIELLTALIRTPHGYEFIAQTGHLGHLLTTLTNPDLNPFAAFLQPTIVRLFSIIARERPGDVKLHYSSFYDYLFDMACCEDLVNQLQSVILGVETFSYLFESNPIKRFINENYQAKLFALLDRLAWLLNYAVNDKLKESVLKCTSELISVDSSLLVTVDVLKAESNWSTSAWNTTEWSELAHLFYTNLTKKFAHAGLFAACLAIAKRPFSELRASAQRYFNALAQTKWGLELLFAPNQFNSAEQFIDGYLLNRGCENEKQGLESKYELIKLLVANFSHNDDLVHLIGEECLAKMRHYVSEGAFYSSAQTRVAFESN